MSRARALVDTTAPGDVVQLAGAITTYVRVIARAPLGLRVSWHGVDYLAAGRRTGVTAGGTAIWTIEALTPWAIEEPGAVAPAPARRRRAKGAPTG